VNLTIFNCRFHNDKAGFARLVLDGEPLQSGLLHHGFDPAVEFYDSDSDQVTSFGIHGRLLETFKASTFLSRNGAVELQGGFVLSLHEAMDVNAWLRKMLRLEPPFHARPLEAGGFDKNESREFLVASLYFMATHRNELQRSMEQVAAVLAHDGVPKVGAVHETAGVMERLAEVFEQDYHSLDMAAQAREYSMRALMASRTMQKTTGSPSCA
jgi:hypothetical protein